MVWNRNYRLPEKGFFSPRQKKQITRLFGCLIPKDAGRHFPGAIDAGAVNFLDKLLMQKDVDAYEEIATWRKAYGIWLEALNNLAIKRFRTALEDLSDKDCNALLIDLENAALLEMPSKINGIEINQKTIFRTMWRHCLQGCFCDPRWGGNKDRMMWKWYGYLPVPGNVKEEATNGKN